MGSSVVDLPASVYSFSLQPIPSMSAGDCCTTRAIHKDAPTTVQAHHPPKFALPMALEASARSLRMSAICVNVSKYDPLSCFRSFAQDNRGCCRFTHFLGGLTYRSSVDRAKSASTWLKR